MTNNRRIIIALRNMKRISDEILFKASIKFLYILKLLLNSRLVYNLCNLCIAFLFHLRDISKEIRDFILWSFSARASVYSLLKIRCASIIQISIAHYCAAEITLFLILFEKKTIETFFFFSQICFAFFNVYIKPGCGHAPVKKQFF